MVSTDRLHITPLSYYELTEYVFGRKGSVVSDEDEAWTTDNVLLPMSEAETDDHIYYTFWVAKRIDGTPIGDIGYKKPPDEHGIVEIGYYVFPPFRGKGYATEMVDGLVEWANKDKRINFVCAGVEPNNIASKQVLFNNGFKHINIKDNLVTFIKQLKF